LWQDVGTNSIKCTCWVKWIHKRCCVVAVKSQDVDASIYHCLQCNGREHVSAKSVGVFMLDTVDNSVLVDKFWYLDDILGKGTGAEESSRTRVGCI